MTMKIRPAMASTVTFLVLLGLPLHHMQVATFTISVTNIKKITPISTNYVTIKEKKKTIYFL